MPNQQQKKNPPLNSPAHGAEDGDTENTENTERGYRPRPSTVNAGNRKGKQEHPAPALYKRMDSGIIYIARVGLRGLRPRIPTDSAAVFIKNYKTHTNFGVRLRVRCSPLSRNGGGGMRPLRHLSPPALNGTLVRGRTSLEIYYKRKDYPERVGKDEYRKYREYRKPIQIIQTASARDTQRSCWPIFQSPHPPHSVPPNHTALKPKGITDARSSRSLGITITAGTQAGATINYARFDPACSDWRGNIEGAKMGIFGFIY